MNLKCLQTNTSETREEEIVEIESARPRRMTSGPRNSSKRSVFVPYQFSCVKNANPNLIYSSAEFRVIDVKRRLQEAILHFDVTDMLGYDPTKHEVPLTDAKHCAHCILPVLHNSL